LLQFGCSCEKTRSNQESLDISTQKSLDISTQNINIYLDKAYPTATNRVCHYLSNFNGVCTAKLSDRLVTFECVRDIVNGYCWVEKI
jgi:nucleoid-associated protein YejK